MVWPIIGTVLKATKIAKVTKVGGAAIKAGKAVGGFAKGVTKELVGAKVKKGASTAVKTGRKTVKVGKALKGLGGGGVAQSPPIEQEPLESPQGRQKTLWTRNIGGNPSHYETHIRKKGHIKAGKKMANEEKTTKKNTDKKSSTKKTKVKKKKTSRLEPLTPTTERFNVDPAIINQLTTGGGMPTSQGGQGPFNQAEQGGGALPPSRDVEEPLWSKALTGTARFLTAGAPAPLRGVVEDVLPSSRYAAEQKKVDEGRNFIWSNVVDKVDTASEIDAFIKNPAYVDAVVSRIPELSNKKDVANFLNFANSQGMKPSELFGEKNWSTTPTRGSVQAEVGGQQIFITPEKEEKYIKLGVGERLLDAETGKVVTKSSKRQEWEEFKTSYKNAKPGRTGLDAHLAFAGLQSGRFTTKVVGNTLVRTDKYTDEQTIITPKSLKNSNIETEIIRDFNGNPIGIMFYDLDEIDPDKGPKIYDPIMFKDILSKEGAPITTEEETGLLPKGIGDFIKGLLGMGTTKKTKGSKAVSDYLGGT